MCVNWKDQACATSQVATDCNAATRSVVAPRLIVHNDTVKYTTTPTEIFFHIYMYNEKRYVGVIVYFTVMFDHPSCFLTFCRSGIPTSCYIFKCFLLLVYVNFFGSRRMFELKFAAEVSDLTGTWAVGVLALPLVYDSGITLPALAEESGPGISSQL